MTTPPRWDLSNIYLSLDDPALAADIEDVKKTIQEAAQAFETEYLPLLDPDSSLEALNHVLNDFVNTNNALSLKAGRIFAYLGAIISTDSFNKAAEQLHSRLAIEMLPSRELFVRVSAWLGALGDRLEKALEIPGAAQDHAFGLLEMAKESRYQMSEPEEILANEMSLSGGSAWGNLQGVLTSQKSVEFEMDGKLQKLPLPALINLRSHPDAGVRERAYKREQEVFEEMKEPLAACLNGVKGEVVTLDRRRGREDCLHSSLDMARIDRGTLEAMLGAIDDSLLTFRRYFRAKARVLGCEKLPWWSLFAPVGKVNKEYTFDEARDLILEHFASFSPELAEFAGGAFEKRWIDAEQRPGKRGGAFCMGVDAVEESRIMSNFDGSFDQVMTLAHELGHGFHNYCAFQAGKTPMQTNTPMTLAETASIMCETIVLNAILKTVSDPSEELAILETSISSDAQTIVDIYSRFIFEKSVFERRRESTLSADEICDLMLEAQRKTYGDGLDMDVLNKFAWTWKPHYYSTHLSFYNYPYAFGCLFAKGLYSVYRERGEAFVEDYKALLSNTGEAQAADLAARFGIDIRAKAFWAASLAQIGEQIERYIAIG
ncbi:MAG: M3 family oligoendopeptidase [Anaerolineaceae bacterium]|jgi:pepF/M3 family oligoendopeptidase|nr:M3 family oligoendopeptidase [Anaerolineaceae bacterium]MDI9531244.1 M3 family oligoendopeptidase [Chloroflexota bacterium]HNZ16572.1 M3 family oligoendopeptidase [Anaerolineaceae bacterium]HOF28071.1 M3 family oligoendopeptidase [Anaerolineaceae bacterium]